MNGAADRQLCAPVSACPSPLQAMPHWQPKFQARARVSESEPAPSCARQTRANDRENEAVQPALELDLLATPIIRNYPKLLQPRKQGQTMPRWRWRVRSSPKILGEKVASETTFLAGFLFFPSRYEF